MDKMCACPDVLSAVLRVLTGLAGLCAVTMGCAGRLWLLILHLVFCRADYRHDAGEIYTK